MRGLETMGALGSLIGLHDNLASTTVVSTCTYMVKSVSLMKQGTRTMEFWQKSKGLPVNSSASTHSSSSTIGSGLDSGSGSGSGSGSFLPFLPFVSFSFCCLLLGRSLSAGVFFRDPGALPPGPGPSCAASPRAPSSPVSKAAGGGGGSGLGSLGVKSICTRCTRPGKSVVTRGLMVRNESSGGASSKVCVCLEVLVTSTDTVDVLCHAVHGILMVFRLKDRGAL
mmetsp:Transcript_3475/g.6851  ORF Transcript_3475/g.6851 Transcript_3475/m.6851 type:complete len:225 (-) Transcript_3475:26-700(-)